MSGLLDFISSPETQIGMGLLGANDGRNNSFARGLNNGIVNAASIQQQQMQQAQAMRQQAAKKKWMMQNMPNLVNAPPEYQKRAYEAMTRAPKAPTAFDQKLELYKNDPKAFAGMYPQKPSTTVNVGGNELKPSWMTDEQKDAQGIPREQAIWIDSKGQPKIIKKRDVGDKKNATALAQMEDATASMNKHLEEYDPNTTSELINALADLPVPVANYIRNETERTMNSEKKTWAEMVLRDATGAVINPSEYKDYDTMFFPQPSESKAEVERKAQKRHSKENAYRERLGMPHKEYVSPYKANQSKQIESLLEKYK